MYVRRICIRLVVQVCWGFELHLYASLRCRFSGLVRNFVSLFSQRISRKGAVSPCLEPPRAAYSLTFARRWRHLRKRVRFALARRVLDVVALLLATCGGLRVLNGLQGSFRTAEDKINTRHSHAALDTQCKGRARTSISRAVLRSRRFSRVFCRTVVNTAANLEEPTRSCTRSCTSVASVLSSSVKYTFVYKTRLSLGANAQVAPKKDFSESRRTHLWILDGRIVRDTMQGCNDVWQEPFEARNFELRGHGRKPAEDGCRLNRPLVLRKSTKREFEFGNDSKGKGDITSGYLPADRHLGERGGLTELGAIAC